MKPLVAIVGRPNVGKSMLFNKLIGQRLSIVEDTPGVTRDRIYGESEWCGRKFRLVDTGGIEPRTDDQILSFMREQAEIAIVSVLHIWWVWTILAVLILGILVLVILLICKAKKRRQRVPFRKVRRQPQRIQETMWSVSACSRSQTVCRSLRLSRKTCSPTPGSTLRSIRSRRAPISPRLWKPGSWMS